MPASAAAGPSPSPVFDVFARRHGLASSWPALRRDAFRHPNEAGQMSLF